MRIAEVNDVAFVATEISGALRERGHTVRLFHPKLIGAGLSPRVKPLVTPLRFVDWLAKARGIQRGGYDAVHIHYAYLGVVGILGRFPYVLHCHGEDLRDLARPFRRPLIVRAIRHASHVYYATPDLAALVRPIRADASFLPNPIDTQLFRPEPVPDDAADVFVVCALTPNKGVARILAACRQLALELPSIRITAVAGGPATAEFDAIPNVTLIAHHPRWKRPGLIARHRVAIGQIHRGAVGMVELEALSCGRPVITRFSYDDVYDEPPPFVRAENPESIVREVKGLLADPARAERIGCAGREWLVRHHDRSRIVERVEESLALVASGRAHASRGAE